MIIRMKILSTKSDSKATAGNLSAVKFMGFSLLSPLEFFVDPKNVDRRNNKPPAM